MNEIKFRGMLHDFRVMPNLPRWVTGFYFKSNNSGSERHYIITDDYTRLVQGVTVGQFTGVKDDKDNDVYDGDKLQLKDSDSGDIINTPIVEYRNGGYGGLDTLSGIFYSLEYYLFQRDYKSEVVGNIHETEI